MLVSYFRMAVWAVMFKSLLTAAEPDDLRPYQNEHSRSDVSYVNMVYFVNWYEDPSISCDKIPCKPQAFVARQS